MTREYIQVYDENIFGAKYTYFTHQRQKTKVTRNDLQKFAKICTSKQKRIGIFKHVLKFHVLKQEITS